MKTIRQLPLEQRVVSLLFLAWTTSGFAFHLPTRNSKSKPTAFVQVIDNIATVEQHQHHQQQQQHYVQCQNQQWRARSPFCSPLFVSRSSAAFEGSESAGSSSTPSSSSLSSVLLQEFTTASGEVLNPYRILKVPQTAQVSEIKQAYRRLSRRFHPDGIRFSDTLPSPCQTLQDVRDHWERIQLSYEILRDPKRRRRYDRNVAWSDPGAALQRAALDLTLHGFEALGHAVCRATSYALTELIKLSEEAPVSTRTAMGTVASTFASAPAPAASHSPGSTEQGSKSFMSNALNKLRGTLSFTVSVLSKAARIASRVIVETANDFINDLEDVADEWDKQQKHILDPYRLGHA